MQQSPCRWRSRCWPVCHVAPATPRSAPGTTDIAPGSTRPRARIPPQNHRIDAARPWRWSRRIGEFAARRRPSTGPASPRRHVGPCRSDRAAGPRSGRQEPPCRDHPRVAVAACPLHRGRPAPAHLASDGHRIHRVAECAAKNDGDPREGFARLRGIAVREDDPRVGIRREEGGQLEEVCGRPQHPAGARASRLEVL